MSIIFSNVELELIENLLGREFITLYEKIWDERNSVKNYFTLIEKNLELERTAIPPDLSGPYSRIYWEYKRGEVMAVLENQSKWLRKVMEQLKGKITDNGYSKLEKYLDENDPTKEFKT